MGYSKLRLLLGALCVIYILSPIIFKHSVFIQRSLLFMNYVNTQYNVNLSHPEQLGLKCTRTLRLRNNLESSDNIEVGAWHILPQSSLPFCMTTHENNRTFIEDNIAFASDSRPIVLYVHGNGGNRAGNHRSRLYHRLAYEHDTHIVAFDYRGYGDSTYRNPTTKGLSSDAAFVYKWLLKQKNVDKSRVTIWGHSLGTGVAIRMLAELPEEMQPKGLILEAGFDTIANAIANHPFSAPFRVIPYFEYFFVDPIASNPELNFDSINKIGLIKPTPIMILHAEDDFIIPFKLGYNLYEWALKKLGEKKVQLVRISATHGLGHKHICLHDETMSKVREFIADKVVKE